MALKVRLRKNVNKTKSSYGKYYAEVVNFNVVDSDHLAEHICQNTTFKASEVKGMLCELAEEMTNHLKMGDVVVLNGIGRFRLHVESDGVDDPSKFNLRRNIRRVVCKFLPAGHRLMGAGEEGKAAVVRDFCKDVDIEML